MQRQIHYILGVLVGIFLLFGTPQVSQAQTPGVAYKIVYNNGTYAVYMQPNATPDHPNLTLTAQVTIKVPHGLGANRFTVTNLQSTVADTVWALKSRIDAPSEAPNADYLSFEVAFPTAQYGAFQWAANTEVAVFTFENSGGCNGAISLLENSDPFMVFPNSAFTNPGNQIGIAGLNPNNSYIGVYGTPADCTVAGLPIKVILGGAYHSNTGLMSDTLHTLPDFPLVSPYGDGATITSSAVLTANNIVDWVFVELRSSVISTTVVMTQAGLLQNDGDVVAVDGVSALPLPGIVGGNYYVAVKHRNHLGVMTAAPITLTAPIALLDLTQTITPVYGTHARQIHSSTGVAMLWPGNANLDWQTIAAGPDNDRNTLLAAVFMAPGNSGFLVNYIINGYAKTDLNLDGVTLASGPNNDDNIILTTIFLHPNNDSAATNFIVEEQLP